MKLHELTAVVMAGLQLGDTVLDSIVTDVVANYWPEMIVRVRLQDPYTNLWLYAEEEKDGTFTVSCRKRKITVSRVTPEVVSEVYNSCYTEKQEVRMDPSDPVKTFAELNNIVRVPSDFA